MKTKKTPTKTNEALEDHVFKTLSNQKEIIFHKDGKKFIFEINQSIEPSKEDISNIKQSVKECNNVLKEKRMLKEILPGIDVEISLRLKLTDDYRSLTAYVSKHRIIFKNSKYGTKNSTRAQAIMYAVRSILYQENMNFLCKHGSFISCVNEIKKTDKILKDFSKNFKLRFVDVCTANLRGLIEW